MAAAPVLQPAETKRKRRSSTYYPLQLSFSYVARSRGQVIQRGLGQTLQISSTCIIAKPIEDLSPATTDVVLSIRWPAKLEDGTHLQCVVQAKPYWDSLGVTEFVILKHEFRTASNALGLRIIHNPQQPCTNPASAPSVRDGDSFRRKNQ
jgi:hypothetical protein